MNTDFAKKHPILACFTLLIPLNTSAKKDNPFIKKQQARAESHLP